VPPARNAPRAVLCDRSGRSGLGIGLLTAAPGLPWRWRSLLPGRRRL